MKIYEQSGKIWACASPVEFVSPFFGHFFVMKLIETFKKIGFPWFSRVKSNRSRSALQFGIGPVPIRRDLTRFIEFFHFGLEETQNQQGKFITNIFL